MKLLASQLHPGENPFHFQSSEQSWLNDVVARVSKEGYELKTPLEVKLNLTKLEPDFYLKGSLKFGVTQSCARCAEYFTLPVVHPFDIALAHVSSGKLRTPEVREESEALDITFFEGNEINLDPILEEQFFLSIPYQSLCRPDCHGVCQKCGSNLNVSSCNCSQKSSSTAFGVLESYQFS